MNNKKLERQNRKFLGVCGGIAAYTGIPVFVIRMLFVMFALWGSTIACYFIAASLMDKAPTYDGAYYNDNLH